jgi:hypothetical protein
MHMYMHACMYVCIYTYVCVCVCVYIYISQIVKKTLNEVARSKQGRALTKQGLIVDQPTSNP